MRRLLRAIKIPVFLGVVGLVTFVMASGWVEPEEEDAPPVTPKAVVVQTPPVADAPAALPAAPAEPSSSPQARRGVYLTANVAGDEALLHEILRRSLEFGFNAVVIDVKDNSGMLGYASQLPQAAQIGSVLPRYDLAQLVKLIHSKGLYFIARLVVFSDPKLAKQLGSANEWVHPSNATAVAYNLAVAQEVAAHGVDEIQFDYIRFPDDGALGVPYPERNAAVADFLQQAQRRLADRVHLSADVFGRTLWDWNANGADPIGQVLERMSPWVDTLSPMIYPSHYERYYQERPYEVVKRGMSVGLERGLTLRPFLQAFEMRLPQGMSLPQYIRAQLKALQELGIKGYLFWNPRGDYSDLWAALAGKP